MIRSKGGKVEDNTQTLTTNRGSNTEQTRRRCSHCDTGQNDHIKVIQDTNTRLEMAAEEALEFLHLRGKPQMILSNDMTNNDKVTWFRAFKFFLAKYELTLTRLISNHVKKSGVCPAANQMCFLCRERGHWARCCTRGMQKGNHEGKTRQETLRKVRTSQQRLLEWRDEEVEVKRREQSKTRDPTPKTSSIERAANLTVKEAKGRETQDVIELL